MTVSPEANRKPEDNILWIKKIRSGDLSEVNHELNEQLDREGRMRRREVSTEDMERRERLLEAGICWRCELNNSGGWNGEYLTFCAGCAADAYWLREMHRTGKAASAKNANPYRSTLDDPEVMKIPVFSRRVFSPEERAEQERREMLPLSSSTVEHIHKKDAAKARWARENPTQIEELKPINYQPKPKRRREGGSF